MIVVVVGIELLVLCDLLEDKQQREGDLACCLAVVQGREVL
jgi:hypothetical protein